MGEGRAQVEGDIRARPAAHAVKRHRAFGNGVLHEEPVPVEEAGGVDGDGELKITRGAASHGGAAQPEEAGEGRGGEGDSYTVCRDWRHRALHRRPGITAIQDRSFLEDESRVSGIPGDDHRVAHEFNEQPGLRVGRGGRRGVAHAAHRVGRGQQGGEPDLEARGIGLARDVGDGGARRQVQRIEGRAVRHVVAQHHVVGGGAAEVVVFERVGNQIAELDKLRTSAGH